MDYKRIGPENIPTKTRYQEVPRYEQGLYDLGGGDYTWLVPNGSWGEANAGLVVGEGESLLVDTLWDVRTTQEMLDTMAALIAEAPIKTLINTHADGDHWFGNQLLSDARIITLQASLDEMQGVKPESLLLLAKIGKFLSLLGGRKAGYWMQGMVAPYRFDEVNRTFPTETFSGEMTLDIGGREVQLIEIGSAHTLGDSMVYVPDTQTLFSADILFIGSTPVMWAGPTENWIAALDKILGMEVGAIVPGHGPITDKGGVRVVREYFVDVQTEVEKRFKSGMSAVEAATDIVLGADYASKTYGGWNSPERIMTTTHTIYRHLEKRNDHPAIPELVMTLRKQAILAHSLMDAEPQIMRYGR